MPCTPIATPTGTAILCTRGRRAPRCSAPGCRRPSAFLCDHPTPGGRRSTCSRGVCAQHRTVSGPLDLCDVHAAADQQLPLLEVPHAP